jgi:hypothetical protein
MHVKYDNLNYLLLSHKSVLLQQNRWTTCTDEMQIHTATTVAQMTVAEQLAVYAKNQRSSSSLSRSHSCSP